MRPMVEIVAPPQYPNLFLENHGHPGYTKYTQFLMNGKVIVGIGIIYCLYIHMLST